MPTATIKQLAGLQTAPNPFSKVPDGALVIADEVMIRGSGVLESRRGLKPSAQGFAADRCFPLPGTTKAITTARLASAPSVYDPDADTVTVLTRSGGIQPLGYPYQSDARVSLWGAVASSLLYLAGQQGLACCNSTTWRAAGLPRPFIIGGGLTGPGPGSFAVFTNQTRRTYRATLAWYDPQGNFLESEPSEPLPLDNSQTVGNWGAIIYLAYPNGAPLGSFIRLWRSLEVPVGTQGSDEMFLVREYLDTSVNFGRPDTGAAWPGQTLDATTQYVQNGNFRTYAFAVTNGFAPTGAGSYGTSVGGVPPNPAAPSDVLFTDSSIDSTLNVPLYTNPQTGDGFGVLSGNARPPAAAVVANFKQRTYFGRPTYQQQLVLQIIGTGTNAGLVDGTTLTIDGITYTGVGGTGANEGLQQFGVDTADTVSKNLEVTARSLARAINAAYMTGGVGYNRSPARSLYAYYASGGTNDFGRIVISRYAPTPLTDDPGAAFSVVSNSFGIRFPGGSATSTDSYSPGGIAWSKPNQPEAVPAINFANVGDPDKAVLGFSVHSDSMIIYKEDGTFILYDQGGPQPIVQVLDPSVITTAPQGIAVLNGAAFVPTARGVLQVTEQGTNSIAEAVRTDLQRLQMQNVDFDARSFAVAYESERLYILGVPSSATENGCSYQYAFNILNQTWVRWLVRGATSGMVLPSQNKILFTYSQPLPDNNIVVGLQSQGVHVERKGGVVSTDYVDLIGSLPAATYAALTVASIPAGVPPSVIARATLTYAQDVHLQVFEGDLLLFQYLDGVDAKTHAQWARVTSVNKAVVSIDTASITTADTTILMTKAPAYYRGIGCHWRFTPITLGEPEYEKQWQHTQHYFDYIDGDWLDVTLDSEKQQIRPVSQVAADPQIVNTSAAMGAAQWLRNTRGVILRVDPGQAEARAARLGIEAWFSQARSNFRLLSASAHAAEWKETGTR